LVDVLALADDSDMVDALEERMLSAIGVEPFDYKSLDFAARVCFIAWGLDSDVNNGGFGQYFCNYTSDGAADAPSVLRRIGENKTARLLERACWLFPKGIAPRSNAERRRVLEQMPERYGERLDRLSRSFFFGNWRLNVRSFLRENTDELLADEARTHGIPEGT
jgi:hypothetical protein